MCAQTPSGTQTGRLVDGDGGGVWEDFHLHQWNGKVHAALHQEQHWQFHSHDRFQSREKGGLPKFGGKTEQDFGCWDSLCWFVLELNRILDAGTPSAGLSWNIAAVPTIPCPNFPKSRGGTCRHVGHAKRKDTQF
jgi:hypothetical protein